MTSVVQRGIPGISHHSHCHRLLFAASGGFLHASVGTGLSKTEDTKVAGIKEV
jgi:hypothetical protein